MVANTVSWEENGIIIKQDIIPYLQKTETQNQTNMKSQNLDYDSLPDYSGYEAMGRADNNVYNQYWTGDKFYGGFGITKDYQVIDYWLLRKRSKQLFNENLYARGLIRRLITNEINTGLALESTPDNKILGIDDEFADDFAETIERRFAIWGDNEKLCDYSRMSKFGDIQKQARMMAIVSGDVLVIKRLNTNGTPNIQLIDAENVRTPTDEKFTKPVRDRGNTIEHGVELNKSRRHIAYFVLNDDRTVTRVPVLTRTGRKQAWLLYGTEKLIDEVRGQSLLALTIQSFKEVDRYRDSEQRAAVINSMIATWVEKTQNVMSSTPFSNTAQRKDIVTTQNDPTARKQTQFNDAVPGMVIQEMNHGEQLKSYDTKRPNVNFAVFEEAIINAIAWANEIPPEIMTLGFSSNYSASQAAVSEFKMYLAKSRSYFGNEFLSPVYEDFFISEALNNTIKADGFLQAYRANQWDIVGAWLSCSWAGAIKPSIDLLKTAKAYKQLVDEGWITNDRASREITGMKFSKVAQQLKRENAQKVDFYKPLMDGGLVRNENQNNNGVSNG